MIEFPTIDRLDSETASRVVVDVFGHIEPRIDETDWWCRMPVRLVHNGGAGWCIEVGPYEVAEVDIETLREAISAYDTATGRTP
ncbi:hypothetical protein A5637_30425 [Mycolicibacterium fortuitum]|uniref:hypothetical protein n=1 Tax=Mycolicibacterium fortuitum TaxID=1766 RepID=UPI0007ED2405|nr:hypothetical protein [Mycolicibacterium fortuitum]OBK09163.1 hypothetical protein A5637_30425 [Mycolicibacterium fortuitum]